MKSELRELGAGGGEWKKNKAVQKHMHVLGPQGERVLGRPLPAAQRGGEKKAGKGNELGRKVMSSSRRGRGPHMLISIPYGRNPGTNAVIN